MSDGINVTRKGTYSVWPISTTILNFPLWCVAAPFRLDFDMVLPERGYIFRLRNKPGFVLLNGLIPKRVTQTKGKPPPRNYDIYLDVVLQELRTLYIKGPLLILLVRMFAFFWFSLFFFLDDTKDVNFSFVFVDSGIRVQDAQLGRSVVCKAFVLFAVADIRAFPHLNAQMSAPAFEGACDQCHQRGRRLGSRMVYDGFYR
jgi:hypothetical protein